MKDPFELFNDYTYHGPLVKHNLTPEEKAAVRKKIQSMTMTPKEEQAYTKELLKGLKTGKFAGYVDEKGEPHVYR